MKKLLSLLCLFALLLSGCASPAPAAETFTDGTGAEVPVSASLDTVAVLFSSYAEVWALAGGEIAITVGEAVARGFADASVLLVDAGSGHTAIDLEALFAAEPDLVIATADYPCQAEAAQLCRDAGIPAALFRQESAEDYLFMLETFCALTGNRTALEEYGTSVTREVQAVLDAAAAETEHPTVLLLRAGSSQRSTKAKGSDDTIPGAILRDLGAVNLADEVPVLLDGLSLEHIAIEDPDWLLISTMGDEAAAREYMAELLTQPGWRELTCVRDGRVVFLDRELYHYKPNHRWGTAYRELFELLYGR